MPFIHRAGGCDVADANSYTETIPTLAGGGVLVISTAARGASVNSPLPILTLGSATFTVAQTFVPLSTRTRHTVFYSTDYAAGTSVSLGVSMSGNLQAGLFWSVEEQLGGTGTLVQSNQTQTPSATLLGTTLAPGSGEMVVSAHTTSFQNAGISTIGSGTLLLESTNSSSPTGDLLNYWDVVHTDPHVTWQVGGSANIIALEFTAPPPPEVTQAEIGWAQAEVPDALLGQCQIAWIEAEVPEPEVPDVGTSVYFDPALSVAAIQDRTDAAGTDVQDVTGEELRLFAMLVSPGIVKPQNGWIVKRGTGMTVTVGSGSAFADLVVIGSTVARQGNYVVRLDEATMTIPIPDADSSLDSEHEVYVVVREDLYDVDTPGIAAPRVALREGEPGEGAPGPDPNWKAYFALAQVNVPAAASQPTVVNLRIPSALATGAPPVGTIVPFAGSTGKIPTGVSGARDWLLCDGHAESRTEFAALFSVIGTTYGNGTGTGSDFSLPDLRRRFTAGKNSSDPLGITGGAWSHTHSIADAKGDTESSGDHDHGGTKNDGDHDHSGETGGSGSLTTGNAGGHSHGGDTTGQSGARAGSDGSPGLYSKTDLDAIATAGEFGDLKRAYAHQHNITGESAHQHSLAGHNHSVGTHAGHVHELAGVGKHKHGLNEHQHGGNTGAQVTPFILVNYVIRAV